MESKIEREHMVFKTHSYGKRSADLLNMLDLYKETRNINVYASTYGAYFKKDIQKC